MKCNWKREDTIREWIGIAIAGGLITLLLLAFAVVYIKEVGWLPFVLFLAALVVFGWLVGIINLCERPKPEYEGEEGDPYD
jgi:CHASE2 domain-containing sensor protein